MRVFALELDNDIKGIERRDEYIEGLIRKLPNPELVVLPELSRCSYMASQEIWKYADDHGRDTSEWAVRIAKTYHTYIGAGYLDRENGDYYNRYMIAGPDGVCGYISKSEGESAVFKRGPFGSVIPTPFGKVGVAICFDSRRRHFYENIQDEDMPGMMGSMMRKRGFRMNGLSRIYSEAATPIEAGIRAYEANR